MEALAPDDLLHQPAHYAGWQHLAPGTEDIPALVGKHGPAYQLTQPDTANGDTRPAFATSRVAHSIAVAG